MDRNLILPPLVPRSKQGVRRENSRARTTFEPQDDESAPPSTEPEFHSTDPLPDAPTEEVGTRPVQPEDLKAALHASTAAPPAEPSSSVPKQPRPPMRRKGTSTINVTCPVQPAKPRRASLPNQAGAPTSPGSSADNSPVITYVTHHDGERAAIDQYEVCLITPSLLSRVPVHAAVFAPPVVVSTVRYHFEPRQRTTVSDRGPHRCVTPACHTPSCPVGLFLLLLVR